MKYLLVLLFVLQGCATTITGSIVGENDNPIKAKEGKVNILLLSKSKRKISHIIDVNENGKFIADENIEPGEYLIEPLIPGYKTTSVKITIKKNIDIKLRAYKSNSIKSSVIGANIDIEEGRGSGGASLTPPKL